MFKNVRKSYLVTVLVMLLIYFGNVMSTNFCDLKKNTTQKEDQDIKKYAGSAVCADCHKDIYDSNIKTAHYLDSRPAARKFIKGSFDPGNNTFVYNKWME
ncbi:MAG TPA: hypothetical protein VLM16_09255, partial [Ginsengibacter sp.]|nr:hypothetical protein [Ginsengibacter sp.]